MNEAQKQALNEEVEAGRAMLETFGDPKDLTLEAEIAVMFAAPGGDGKGAKRWTGTLIDVITTLARFSATLYADGGRIERIEIACAGNLVEIDGARWEKAASLAIERLV